MKIQLEGKGEVVFRIYFCVVVFCRMKRDLHVFPLF